MEDERWCLRRFVGEIKSQVQQQAGVDVALVIDGTEGGILQQRFPHLAVFVLGKSP